MKPSSSHIGHVVHLIKRFGTSLSTRPPTQAAQAWATSQLLAGEQALWAAMPTQDRRHATTVAYRFLDGVPDAPRAAIAAIALGVAVARTRRRTIRREGPRTPRATVTNSRRSVEI